MIKHHTLIGWRPAHKLPDHIPHVVDGLWFEIEDMMSREIAYLLYITDPSLRIEPLMKRVMLYSTPETHDGQTILTRTELSPAELEVCQRIVIAILRSHMTINSVEANPAYGRIEYRMTNTATRMDLTGYYSREGIYVLADTTLPAEMRDLAVQLVIWYNNTKKLDPILTFLKDRGYPIAWALDLRRLIKKADYKAAADWLRSVPRPEREQARMVFTGLIMQLF